MGRNRSSAGVLEDIFGTKARLALLRLLCRETQPLTARQLGELAGLNHRTVVDALDPLTHRGVVEKRHAGPAYLYSLAKENLIAQKIVRPVIEAEQGLSAALRDEIVALFVPGAISVVLFGSVARGEEKRGSDVDVLVVVADEKNRSDAEARAFEASHSFYLKFGRPLSVHCVTRGEVREGRSAFVAEAARRWEVLFGEPPVTSVGGDG